MTYKATNYYEARGFSIYYFANAVFNVVSHPVDYLRGIEDILGDARTEFIMKPFKKYTNLHNFVENICSSIILANLERGEDDLAFLQKFLEVYGVACPHSALQDEDTFADFTLESTRFHEAMDEITDEVFHILFVNVGFLQQFNRLCAGYIENSGFGQDLATKAGTLKRVSIPMWARRAIFHRDKGECRACKRSLASIITQLDTERYDHIVPLARFGANDVTNLQLLCEQCNLKKSAEDVPTSRFYQRAIRI